MSSSTRWTFPPVAGGVLWARAIPSNAPRAERYGRGRFPSRPMRTLLGSATRRSGKGPLDEDEEELAQTRHDASAGRRAGGRSLRLVSAWLLPAVAQGGGPGRGGGEAAARARVLVREDLARNLEPGRENPGPVRDARRPARRRLAPGSVNRLSDLK